MIKRFSLLILALSTISCIGAQRQSEANKKLSLAEFAISNLYVDNVDESKLVEDAIRGMLEKTLYILFRQSPEVHLKKSEY